MWRGLGKLHQETEKLMSAIRMVDVHAELSADLEPAEIELGLSLLIGWNRVHVDPNEERLYVESRELLDLTIVQPWDDPELARLEEWGLPASSGDDDEPISDDGQNEPMVKREGSPGSDHGESAIERGELLDFEGGFDDCDGSLASGELHLPRIPYPIAYPVTHLHTYSLPYTLSYSLLYSLPYSIPSNPPSHLYLTL